MEGESRRRWSQNNQTKVDDDIHFRLQPKQELYCGCTADMCFYGGAAGGGKTWASLTEPISYVDVEGFTCVIFRRTMADVKKPGSLWDESHNIYPYLGARPNISDMYWRFPSGVRIQFSGIERESDKYDWQGASLCLQIFEEVTHFTETQFWYMFTRSRSTCGVKPYVRATCNPDSDSWVRKLIDWWIGPDGYAIDERSGVIRYFTRLNDKIIWSDTREELMDIIPDLKAVDVNSFTFIPSKLRDNPALTKKDPSYEGKLKAQDQVTRKRLLDGNWNIRPSAGMYFQREWMNVIPIFPPDITWCRAWDFAATIKTDGNDPDQSANILIGKCPVGKYYIAEANAFWGSPHQVRRRLKKTAQDDGYDVMIRIPQDPAQAGKAQAQDMITDLDGYSVVAKPVTGDKITRYSGFSSQAEGGNVYVLESTHTSGGYDEWYNQQEGFPEIKLKDLVDCTSDGYDLLRRYSALIAV